MRTACGDGAFAADLPLLLDTNILIDYLNTVPQARTELARFADKAVSIVTGMEVMIGADAAVEVDTRKFLSSFDIVAIDERIAERAASLRRTHGVKLPDAVIWASAEVHGMLFVTRNIEDFPAGDPGVRAPYRL